jgi:hypothetical protein
MKGTGLIVLGRAAVAAAVCALPFAAGAEIYKCVDGNGRVRFSELPPKAGDCRTVDEPAAASVGANANRESMQQFIEQADKARTQQRDEKERVQQAKAARDERCRLARKQVMYWEQAGVSFYRLKDDGQREYVGNDERQQSLDEARAQVREHCG